MIYKLIFCHFQTKNATVLFALDIAQSAIFKANVVFPILGREAIAISLEEGGKAVSYFQVYILAFFLSCYTSFHER